MIKNEMTIDELKLYTEIQRQFNTIIKLVFDAIRILDRDHENHVSYMHEICRDLNGHRNNTELHVTKKEKAS
jgi:hypothetical protein